jgi:hypothetical protein
VAFIPAAQQLASAICLDIGAEESLSINDFAGNANQTSLFRHGAYRRNAEPVKRFPALGCKT